MDGEAGNKKLNQSATQLAYWMAGIKP